MKAGLKNGLLLMASSALLLSMLSALAKFAASSLPSSEVVFFRSLGAVVLLLTIHFGKRGRAGPLLGHHRKLLALRGLCGAFALMMFFFALSRLAVADAVLLNQCSPLFVLFLAVPFLGEGIRRAQLMVVPITLAGVVLVLQPNFEVLNWAGLAALGSGALAGCAYICVRKITREEQAHVVVLYFATLAVVVSFPFMLSAGFVMPDVRTWLALGAIAILSVASQMLLTAAYRYDRAGRVAMAGYLGPVFAAVWDAWFWGRIPGWVTILGAALIIGSLIELNRQGKAIPPRPA